MIIKRINSTMKEGTSPNLISKDVANSINGLIDAAQIKKILDNSNSQKINPITTDADSGLATITLGGSDSALTELYKYLDFPSKFSHSAAISLEQSGDQYRVYNTTAKSGANISGEMAQTQPSWEFYTDCEKLLLSIKRTSKFTIQVDGVFVSKSNLLAPDTGNNNSSQLVDFGSRAIRKITVNFQTGGDGFRGVAVKPTDSVWGVEPASVSMGIVGDSYSTGTAPNVAGLGWATALSKSMNILDYGISGEGATGFVNNQSDVKYNYLERVGDLTYRHFDIILACITLNDDLFNGGLAANINAWHSAIRAANNKALIIVTGAPRSNNDTNTVATETLAISTFEALNDANMIIIPVLTSDDPPIFGTGDDGSLEDDGNADIYIDSDGLHYNLEGHIFWSNWVFQKIINKLESLS